MTDRLRSTLRTGLFGGLAVIYVALVGMLETFAVRNIISDVLSMGFILVAALILMSAHSAARKAQSKGEALLSGTLVGLIIGLMIVALAVIVNAFPNLRNIFVYASPKLVQILTFGKGVPAGLPYPLIASVVLGFLAGGLATLSARLQRVIIVSISATLLVGLLKDVIRPTIPSSVAELIYSSTGLTWVGTFLVLAVVAVVMFVVTGRQERNQAKAARGEQADASVRNTQRKIWLVLLVVFLATFPLWSKVFLSNVADFVGLYVIMGLGLNLVVGFAGMLDLGYVGFYAIGAYTMAIFTSPDLGLFHLTFWEALPLAMIAALVAGVLLGLPVLRMRGDYLAIATLGFGEIIRILLLSDWLKPYTGGAQGITEIASPTLFGFTFDTPQSFYYLILIGCLVAWFVASRLKSSRLGRSWMAIREDEDVAQAMGINRVAAKLMAFATGAFLGGMAGALFASMIGSVVPRSFDLLVSINVLAVIIVGGMGSLPGVVVGALVLVGLPELLREFNEYRLLVYGLVLMLMMLYRPEGLWPESTRRRELKGGDEPPSLEETSEGPTLAAMEG